MRRSRTHVIKSQYATSRQFQFVCFRRMRVTFDVTVCDLFFDQSMHWSRFSRSDGLTARELNYKFSVWSQRQMRQTTDRRSPKKNVAQFWDHVFSTFLVKKWHLNIITCRTVRQVTFRATSDPCTDTGRDKSPVLGQTYWPRWLVAHENVAHLVAPLSVHRSLVDHNFLCL